MFPPNFGWSLLAILATGLLSKRPLLVSAQWSTLSQYNWMDNSKAQNPCLVAAYAQGVCDGIFSVDTLSSTYLYVGPSVEAANSCKCNSITYNLIAACSICQNGSYISWSSWSTNCSTIYLVCD
ncbi:hypothetical protein SCLCIDRAFT_1217229 [Scleroderma citrinum Foug A]|uniref:Cyanovirin-N domain-containing protein n=1 Tax=Scleroderma citrinum Foug A TaxID=1036808 RepID=A0A0C3DGY9_9AGAM|nr:hypothetical protein SCLCIDRAFT_1217229 [Scleroderma citrinum Foug A]